MPENVTNGDHAAEVQPAGEGHENDEEVTGDDVYFDPIITLPLIEVSNNEEDEIEMIKLRAKLYRYDASCSPAEWKERGTGDVKLLRHKTKHTVRVVMRRDKTLKICANHFVTPWMELKPNCGSDRAWVWSVLADFADEHLTSELLAIRFATAENAQLWKDAFEKAKKIVGTECEIYAGKPNPDDKDVDSDSDTCSYVTYSDSSDNEDPEKSSRDSEKQKVNDGEKADDKSTEEVTEVLKKLDVGEDLENKEETK
ncbi:ran-specific GTPase-activating protein-like [Venturia canescens]|uniref:ran-specific GTPase-activating protein-like n=1 Tax=Venturia canescens TaxID=32260 RepID=UPI001C9D57E9|nr:ran-specific GTPase-activating protein-like [Venturia canescens]